MNGMETPLHFLMTCRKYKNERERWKKRMRDAGPQADFCLGSGRERDKKIIEADDRLRIRHGQEETDRYENDEDVCDEERAE